MVMGVVNVTPDSFTDGGIFLDRQAAIDQSVRMMEEGADIIDIGGESTRPGAQSVTEAEELSRVLPVIEGLAGRLKIPLSIDTQKASVAEAAIKAGASIVNDVGAAHSGDRMWELLARTGAGYVAMHMQGTPVTMQTNPVYANVVAELRQFFQDRLEKLHHAGVASEQVILDVGIGFGKSLKHNLELLAGTGNFNSLGRPLLLGLSRKSFVSKLLGVRVEERLPAVLAATVCTQLAGARIFRTHDVAATVQALRMTEAIGSSTK